MPTIRLMSCLLFAAWLIATLPAQAEVFVNELHYDDNTASGDIGERIEIVATDGDSLDGFRLYLYNGSTPSAAKVYDNDPVPAGALTACGANVRVATLGYPSNSLQNGPNDALALVDAAGVVRQFLSYEGQVTAADGPARGLRSVALPVAESGTAASGSSLQLGGSGRFASDFRWQASQAETFGACNRNQNFIAPNPPPLVTGTVPSDGATGFPPSGALQVDFSESVTLASGAFALQCSQSGAVALTHAASGTRFDVGAASTLRADESCSLTIVAAKVSDAGGATLLQDRVVAFRVASASGGAYYDRVNTTSPAQLRCSLHQSIRGHTVYPYSGGTTNTWSILEIADEDPLDAGYILDAYRNRRFVKGGDRAGTGSGLTYNREHSWPNSLGFGSASGDRGLPNAPYTDTHMLYLTDTRYNADRGNKPYAECRPADSCGERGTEANHGRGGGSGVYPGQSNWVRGPEGNEGAFQVWSARRGDMARAVLYMAVRYEGGRDARTGQAEPDLELTDDRSRIRATSASPAYMGLLSTLLAWHQADPPDAAERTRNEVIFSFQGNRNPFVDHPEWATRELFTSVAPAVCQLP